MRHLHQLVAEKQGVGRPVGVWHEALSGRSADAASAFNKILQHESFRDFKDFVFWTDNGCEQNKNWYLFSFLCQ